MSPHATVMSKYVVEMGKKKKQSSSCAVEREREKQRFDGGEEQADIRGLCCHLRP